MKGVFQIRRSAIRLWQLCLVIALLGLCFLANPFSVQAHDVGISKSFDS